jgi:2-iminobutanoate/2-iminopropanoate deaminase
MPKRAFLSSAAPLSPAIRVGDTVFVSGQVPVDEHGKVVGEDIAGQTAQVLRNVERALEAAGATRRDVVKTLVILSNVKRDFAGMNAVYAEFFPDPKPARSTIGADLAIDVLVEIEAMAIVEDAG